MTSQTLADRQGKLFTLPPLPYNFNALEPYIDAQTMEIHHDKHHQAYVTKLNEGLAGAEQADVTLETILKQVSKWPTTVRNNGGGHWNHTFFWKIMTGTQSEKSMSSNFETLIKTSFGSWDDFKKKFEDTGAARFGSGWVWLIKTADKKLQIMSTPNQDNPLMDVAEVKGTPILGCDVWEHAYYLKYQNRRPEYLKNFWNVINWKLVEEYYKGPELV